MQLVLPKGKVMATHILYFTLPFLSSIKTGPFLKVKILDTRMEITVNQQAYQVTDVCSVQQLLSIVLSTPAKGIAVAVNQAIIAKTDWSTHLLNPNDHIIIIKATQGG